VYPPKKAGNNWTTCVNINGASTRAGNHETQEAAARAVDALLLANGKPVVNFPGEEAATRAAFPNAPRFSPTAPVPPFVKTLWDLVSGRPEETLCQWDTCGRRVVFTDPQRFAAQVCPQHFRHSNWSSFSRMLNMYDFRKVSRKPRAAVGGSQVQVFEHDHFRRGGEPRAPASFFDCLRAVDGSRRWRLGDARRN